MSDDITPILERRADWSVGDVILDLYEVQGKTQGGMGAVYFVWHKNWRTRLAMKSPLPELVAHESAYKRFIREAETWVDLGLHPNIASCYYVREIEGLPRIFIEYVDGGDLAGWIKQGKIKEWKTILDLAIQFCDGIAYAHSRGLVHRDIKPANCLITKDGTLKITDFGIVKVKAPDISGDTDANNPIRASGGTITVNASGMGTPHYMAPEQWHSAKVVGPEADIYSFGIMFYEMCCGRRPFDLEPGEPLEALHAKHLVAEPPDPRQVRKDLPAPLSHLILNCLEKKAEHRYASFAEVRERLVEIFRQTIGMSYARPQPEEIKLKADSLNNRGVSLHDLGYKDQAHQAFEEALHADPQHLEANTNLCILDWREAQITDMDLLTRLRGLSDAQGKRSDYWRIIGEAHVCLGAMERAKEALGKAFEICPECEGSKVLLQKALKAINEDCGWARLLMTFEGHTENVSSVYFSPDGRLGLSGGDQTLRLWDLATGQCLRIFEGHTDLVQSVAISPDGRFGLSGSTDRTLRLWNLATGQCMTTLKGHKGSVQSVAISPDGRFGLSGGLDLTLRLWDLATGQCMRIFGGHAYTFVVISPDGKFGLSGSPENAHLWDLATGQCLKVFEGHYNLVCSVTFSPDGRLGLSGGDYTLRLWNLATGQCLRTLEGHTDSVTSIAFSPDGKLGLSGSTDKTLRLWDLATGQCLRTLEGHTDFVTSVAFSPDGRLGLSGSTDKTLRLWDLATGYTMSLHQMNFILSKPIAVKEIMAKGEEFSSLILKAKEHFKIQELKSAVLTLQEARKIPGYERNPELLDLWSYASNKSSRTSLEDGWGKRTFEGHTYSVDSAAFSPDGRLGLSGSSDQALRLWDLATGQCLRTFEGHTYSVVAVAFSPDGRLGLSGSSDQTLRLWDLATGQCLKTFEGHTAQVLSLAISPDGKYVLSGSSDKTLRLWNLSTGLCLKAFEGHTEQVLSVAISPDGRIGLSGSKDAFRLWDLATGQCIRTVEGLTEQTLSFAFRPDGRLGLSGSEDNTIRLLDLATGQCLRTLEGHTEGVNSVAFSPDGRFGLSGSSDQTLRVWNLATGKCLKTLAGHTEQIFCVAISPDGRLGLSGSEDETLRLWEFVWGLDI